MKGNITVGAVETRCEIALIRDTATKAQKDLDKINKDLEKAAETQAKSSSQLAKSQAELETVVERQVEGKEELTQAKSQGTTVTDEMRAAVASAEEAKASLQASSQNSRSRGVVAQLMKASKKGGALAKAGVIGRLGDLGAIDEEYDVAISTACGLLDYIVVESSAGGKVRPHYTITISRYHDTIIPSYHADPGHLSLLSLITHPTPPRNPPSNSTPDPPSHLSTFPPPNLPRRASSTSRRTTSAVPRSSSWTR